MATQMFVSYFKKQKIEKKTSYISDYLVMKTSEDRLKRFPFVVYEDWKKIFIKNISIFQIYHQLTTTYF